MVTNLVTDNQAVNPAQITDPNLVNAWGISHSGTSPFWVSDNGTGLSTLYSVNPTTNATAIVPLVVSIPPVPGGTPTGQVFNDQNATGAFNKDLFLFVSEDGTISGWRGALGTTAEILQSSSTDNVYKGTTLDTTGTLLSSVGEFPLGHYRRTQGRRRRPRPCRQVHRPRPSLRFRAFNIQKLGNKIYVTYALQDGAKHDDVAGPGNGFVSAFDLNGNFLGRVGQSRNAELSVGTGPRTDFVRQHCR